MHLRDEGGMLDVMWERGHCRDCSNRPTNSRFRWHLVHETVRHGATEDKETVLILGRT